MKEGSLVQPKLSLIQEVVSASNHRQRGQRIVVPVRKLFAREKRPYGLGMVGRLTNRSYRKRIDSNVQKQIEDMDGHRYRNLTRTEGGYSGSDCVERIGGQGSTWTTTGTAPPGP